MKHSVIVFFVWHGLESCWRLAVVEPDESIVFYGLESCWCFGLFESDADETLEQPSFGIHVLACGYMCVSNSFFCLAEARLLLAFGCFGTEALFFLIWVPKVTWSILSACFLLGMGSNLAGVSVFSNLTLTRLWAAIVRNPRFERFFAWQRLDCCWRSGVSEPKLCFLCEADSVCVFFAWRWWRRIIAGQFWSFRLWRMTRLWAAIVRNPRRSGVPEPDQSFFYLVFFHIFSGLFFLFSFFF